MRIVKYLVSILKPLWIVTLYSSHVIFNFLQNQQKSNQPPIQRKISISVCNFVLYFNFHIGIGGSVDSSAPKKKVEVVSCHSVSHTETQPLIIIAITQNTHAQHMQSEPKIDFFFLLYFYYIHLMVSRISTCCYIFDRFSVCLLYIPPVWQY